jgi:hypothetical protein
MRSFLHKACLQANIFGPITLLALLALGTGAFAEEGCDGILANPVHQELNRHYSVLVADTPIVRQCSGTCHLESTASFAENIAQVPLATNYNLIAFLRDQATEALKGKNLLNLQIQNGFIDLLASGVRGGHALDRLERQGVVQQGKFAYTDKFSRQIASIREIMDGKLGRQDGKPLPDLEILNGWVGIVLKMSQEAMARGEVPAIDGTPIQNIFDQVFNEALAGASVDPHQEFQRLFPQKEQIIIWSRNLVESYKGNLIIFNVMKLWHRLIQRSTFRFTTSLKSKDQIEIEIMKSLRTNKAVWMSFHKAFKLIDPKTGVIRLDVPRSQVGADREKNPEKYEGGFHGVVIQGFEPDVNGNIDWLLIRDSEGSEVSDHGYLHMHINYFRQFVDGLMFH